MSAWLGGGEFLFWFAVVALSSVVLETSLHRVGARLHFSDSLQGIVTALGADAPEIATALTAMAAGQHDVGTGVVLGSNIFNLAALLGLSAIVAGRVTVHRWGLILDGGVAAVITILSALTVLGYLRAWLALVVVCLVMAPYVTVAALGRPGLAKLRLPSPLRRRLLETEAALEKDVRPHARPREADAHDVLALAAALVAIVVGSVEMVRLAVLLGGRWHVSPRLVGVLVLAALTGLPNTIAALQLARRGRSAAVLSETLNSNTFNVLVGICLGGAVLGLQPPTAADRLEAWWMCGMTAVALLLSATRRGVGRRGGVLLCVLYLAFAVLIGFL